MPNEILTEITGNVLAITFNRPDRGNALSPDMANQVFNILKNATTDRGVRAILLRGAGDNYMNGLELNLYVGDFGGAVERHNQLMQPYHSAIRELHAMEKPVLSAVKGLVAGPGLSFMLASDLVLAGRSTTFNAAFTSYAMTPDGGTTFNLPRKVGAAKALEILMLSEPFDAAAAEKLQLVNGVIDDDKLDNEALQWVNRLASGPTRAFGGVKRLIGMSFEQDINAQLSLEHSHWGASTRSFDFRDAIKAHFAKRPPKYSGA